MLLQFAYCFEHICMQTYISKDKKLTCMSKRSYENYFYIYM